MATRQSSRRLRTRMTRAEAILWTRLRSRQVMGFRFRRQHPAAGAVVDFACPARRLAIEVDGEIHDDRDAPDTARTQRLANRTYRVVRFPNWRVIQEINEVIREIEGVLQEEG